MHRKSVEKPWGRDILPAPFTATAGQRIGEIWFEPDAAQPSPLMIKYIFTSEKLSVQVHPSDAQAHATGLAGGKEECWLIIDAEPDATLGIGTKRPLGADELRDTSLSGAIEDLIDWKPVKRGDFFYVPAGTVHAIGAGVSLIEVQQNADITYRLYDYGRPRELHLDEGVDVARATPYDLRLHQVVPEKGTVSLVDGPLFRVLRCDGAGVDLDGWAYVVPLDAPVDVEGEPIQPGDCALTDSPGSARSSGLFLIAQAC